MLTSSGPVVRITPDEVHVQEQFYDTRDADSWIKGTKTKTLTSGRHQSGYTSPRFQIRKRSMSRVRSILQVEVHQIIRELVRKHQVHRVLNWRIRSLTPEAESNSPETAVVAVDAAEMGDLEDGNYSQSWMTKQIPRNQYPFRSPKESNPGLWEPGEVNQTHKTNEQSLPF